ncbi:MAG: MATE family efflux transporter, partial [Coriobacteriales bacterium]
FITAQGFSLMGMLSVVIGAVVNIALDPLLIYGFSMGVRGAAIATVVSQTVSAVWVVGFLLSKKTILRIRLKYFKVSWASYLPCVFLGASPFIMQFTESVISICFNVSLLKYGGTLAVGAMTILYSVMQFAMLPLQGLTQGAQPIVSYNYGAGQRERVKKTFGILLRSCLIYSTALWATCMLFPQLFAKM